MSIVRVGSTQKFSDNWDQIFSGKKAAPAKKSDGKKKKPAKAAKPSKSSKKK